MAEIRGCLHIALIVAAISMIGMCNGDNSTSKENVFLLNKWKMYFQSFDVNHDGRISKEDVEESDDNLIFLEHLDADETQLTNADLTQIRDNCWFKGTQRDILEKEFVDTLKTDFNADEEKFKRDIFRCTNKFFSTMIDINEDGFISKEEHRVTYASYGHQHIAENTNYFLAFNPNNGLVPLSVVVDSWVDLVTSTDESKCNIVKIGFDIFGFK